MSEHEESTSVASQIDLQLSAFADGELTAAEAEFLSRRISVDPALRRRLCQYYLIGSIARGERPVPASFASGLAGRLGDAIDAPADDGERAPIARSDWQRLVGGGAIAAGVAALALFGLNQTVEQSRSPAVVGTAGMTGAPTYTVPTLSDDATQPQISLSEPRLVNYMLRHGQIATPLIVETDLEGAAAPGDDAACADQPGSGDAAVPAECQTAP